MALFSAWCSRSLFEIFENDRIFEEMDKMSLEMSMLDYKHLNNSPSTLKCMVSTGFCVGVATIGAMKFWTRLTFAEIGAGSCGVLGVGAIAIYSTNRWISRKARFLKKILETMETTKMAVRKRQQIFFSISMQLPQENSLNSRCCCLATEAVRVISDGSKNLQNYVSKPAEQMWTDLYSPEIKEILERENVGAERNGGDEIFETLIAMFRLHLSEYSKFLIVSILDDPTIFAVFARIWEFRKICRRLKKIMGKLEDIQKSALRGQRTSSVECKFTPPKIIKLRWDEHVIVALEAISESLKNKKMTSDEVEVALKRTLALLAGVQRIDMENEKSQHNAEENVAEQVEENGNSKENSQDFEAKFARTDIDMVFEGETLSENEKISIRETCTRDVLLDGCESRRHEASLLGELQMVLEPRRNDFVKREKTALAKFYGIDEEELEKREKETATEEEFEGVGQGNEEDINPYDWRRDAEESFGLHKAAQDLNFLEALASRCVNDNVIE